MKHISGKFGYQCIVRDLVDEFRVEIDNGAARSVANAVIGGFDVHAHEATVLHAVEYQGGPVESLDAALNPYEVMQYSDANIPMVGYGDQQDQAAARAAQCLSRDLLDAREEPDEWGIQ